MKRTREGEPKQTRAAPTPTPVAWEAFCDAVPVHDIQQQVTLAMLSNDVCHRILPAVMRCEDADQRLWADIFACAKQDDRILIAGPTIVSSIRMALSSDSIDTDGGDIDLFVPLDACTRGDPLPANHPLRGECTHPYSERPVDVARAVGSFPFLADYLGPHEVQTLGTLDVGGVERIWHPIFGACARYELSPSTLQAFENDMTKAQRNRHSLKYLHQTKSYKVVWNDFGSREPTDTPPEEDDDELDLLQHGRGPTVFFKHHQAKYVAVETRAFLWSRPHEARTITVHIVDLTPYHDSMIEYLKNTCVIHEETCAYVNWRGLHIERPEHILPSIYRRIFHMRFAVLRHTTPNTRERLMGIAAVDEPFMDDANTIPHDRFWSGELRSYLQLSIDMPWRWLYVILYCIGRGLAPTLGDLYILAWNLDYELTAAYLGNFALRVEGRLFCIPSDIHEFNFGHALAFLADESVDTQTHTRMWQCIHLFLNSVPETHNIARLRSQAKRRNSVARVAFEK